MLRGNGKGGGYRRAGALVPGTVEAGIGGRAQEERGRGRDVYRIRLCSGRGDLGGVAEAVMAGFFAEKVFGFMGLPWEARGGEVRAGQARGVGGFGGGSEGRRVWL